MDCKALVERQRDFMCQVNDFVYTHPELGYEEYQCSDYLVEIFERMGLLVERPVVGMDTAFKVTLQGQAPGPKVGIVLLFDAVPAVQTDRSYSPNHSCGHNVIAAAVTGAMRVLADALPKGELVVFGLPGDEIGAARVMRQGGSKARTAAAGEWDGFDAIFYAHPEFSNTVSYVSRWMERYQIALNHPRHLAQAGELQGSVLWVVHELLAALRDLEVQHTQEFVMIKDVWIDGDVEYHCMVNAQIQVLLFGLSQPEVVQRRQQLQQVVDSIRARSQIAIQLDQVGDPYMGVRPNQTLSAVVHEAMKAANLSVLYDPEPLPFATDFGNISRRAPAALIGIGRKGGWQFHTLEGADEFGSRDGTQAMITTAEVLVRATMRLWEQPGIIDQIRADFNQNI